MLASTNPGIAERIANDHGECVREVLPKPFDLQDFYLKLRQVVGITMP